MSQDEYHRALPGHADFVVPEPVRAYKPLNGKRPIPMPAEEPPAPPSSPVVEPDPVDVWDQRVASGLAFLRRRLAGAYQVDEFGFDRELSDAVFHPMLRVLYRDWFRTEVFGVGNV